ncbi:MAG: PAS domain S-box protein [Crocinitomicaceae bacterium]
MGISRNITEYKELEKSSEIIVNSATDLIYTTNYQGELTFLNQGFERMLGLDPVTSLGASFIEFIHPDWRDEVQAHYQETFESKKPSTYLEFQLIKSDGSSIWVGQNVTTRFSLENRNKIEGFFGIVRDISERKETELLLAQSESRFRELFENSSDLIQEIDATGNIKYVNKAWLDTLEYSAEECETLNLFQIIHPESTEHCQDLFQAIMSTGQCEVGRPSYFMKSKSGKKVYVEGAITIKKQDDQIVGIQSFLRDITQQEITARKLQESEEKLRIISDTLNDVFFLYDIKAQKYQYISKSCEKILGADQDFFYSGKSHTNTFVLEEDRNETIQNRIRVENGESYSQEYRILVNGEIKWINEKSFPVFNDQNELIMNSGICRDITKEKNLSELAAHQSLEITQSINYAKNIQLSTLPTNLEFNKLLSDAFVFYEAKDNLSGDFYVVDEINSKIEGNMKAIIVADCTGHGVPGGILSLLCNALLKETFSHKEINSPSEALDFVRNKLIELFRYSGQQDIQDGMDAAFCVVNAAKDELKFSGANLNCYIYRDNEIITLKGDRQHVGKSLQTKEFTTTTFNLRKNDTIYLFSDGFIDQFGGPASRKFMKGKLLRILGDIYTQPMENQLARLKSEFFDWKGDIEQTDDVTVLGFRY